MNVDSSRGPEKTEVIIVVHGTGAGQRNPADPHWWEVPHSAFARELESALGSKCCFAEPFCWNGNNYESDRRSAANELLDRLRKEDKAERRYHLIGHSHGGSIIWHALVGSVGFWKKPLSGLATWTTVGTPFLTFKPDYGAWWLPVATAAALAGCVAAAFILWEPVLEHDAILSDANTFALVGTLALFGLLAAISLWLTVQSGRLTAAWVATSLGVIRSRIAAREYHSRWLAIWHVDDEPIGGLAGTLVDPASVASRKAGINESRFRKAVISLYNAVAARPLNQFAWTIVMSRLQGSDILGLRMTGSADAPEALLRGQPALRDPIASDLRQAADRVAGESVSGIRQQLSLLSKLKTGDEAIARLARTITWRELIHTSYFNQAEVVRAIARHVGGAPGPCQGWTPAASPIRPQRPFHALAAAKAALVLLVVGSLSLAAFSAFNAAIAPYTASYQLRQIANSVASERGLQPELVNLRYDSAPGELLIRLYALGELDDPKGALQRIANEDTRGRAAQRLAYSLGHAGKASELSRLIADVQTIPGFEGSRVRGAVALQGLLGVLTTASEVDRSIVSKALDSVEDSDRLVFEAFMTQWIIPSLYARGLDDMARRAGGDRMNSSDGDCGEERNVVLKAARLGASEIALQWIEKCRDGKRVVEILDLAVSEAYGRRHSAAAARLLQRRVEVQALSPPFVAVDTVNILLDANRTADAIRAATMLLERWRQTKPRTGAREVASLATRLRAHGEAALGAALISIVEAGVRDQLTQEDDDREKIATARDLAFLLAHTGRRPEALQTATDASQTGEAQIAEKGYNAAIHFIIAGVTLAEVGEKSAAADRLKRAKVTLSNYYPLENRIALYDATIESLALIDPVAARAAIDACIADNARVDIAEIRARNFAALARRFMSIQDAYRARMIAERAGGSEQVLSGYKDILDSKIEHRQPESRERFALDEKRFPSIIPLFSEELPPKSH